MSYPEPRYLGEQGEVSALFRAADTGADVLAPSGNRTHYLATHTSTDGGFGLYRIDMGPGSPGPSTHFHRSISESFYVLSGTIRLHDGNGWTEGRPGDFLYVPQGGVHGFRNESGEPASMLILFTPGAPREDYFERVRTTSAMTEEERAEFFLRHDTFWV